MFCPKCATQNIEGASFCRVCGANISLIPQALSGQLPQPPSEEWSRYSRRLRRRWQPSVEDGIRQLAVGFGFLFVSFAIARNAPAGHIWWFWLLLPAFALLGKGISQIMRARTCQSNTPPPAQFAAPQSAQGLPPRNTAELMPPVPSVTEGTTRHLGTDAATRHFDSLEGKPS
jgi:hypothetical protein